MSATSPPAAEFRVLGPLEILDDQGGALVLSGARQRLLAALLISRAGKIVGVYELAEHLWGEALPDDPKGSLQNQVWRLRGRLGARDLIEATADGYRFTAPDRVDVTGFEELVAAARGCGTDPEAALGAWEAALGLWRGPALGELAEHPGLAPEAARLEGLRAEAAQARVDALLAAGSAGPAAAAARALVEDDPFGDRPVELLMLALCAAGRFVDALSAYEAYRVRLGEELGLDPPPALRALEGRIIRHELAVPAPSRARIHRPPTLATPPDAFIARSDELATLDHAVGQSRLVTITGPGGVGKTRLALQFLEGVASRYPDGVWCADLSAVESGGDVAEVVASALRVEGRASTSTVERLAEALALKQAVLFLDNCEQVLTGAAELVTALVRGTDQLTILVTSREPMRVPGEQRVPVTPLAVPTGPEPDTPALSLFLQRARAVNPDFGLDDEELTAVADLCRQLDGLPLALELAAARVSFRTVWEIADEVGQGLAEIRQPAVHRPRRQLSTHEAVAWSYDLLSEDEQRAFEQLAVFAGGWDTAAAAAVGADEPLARLVERSLVTATPAGRTTRYRFLEPIRAYAEVRLRQRGGYEPARDRHARYFADVAEAADAGLRSSDEAGWVARIERELPNLRTAVGHLMNTGDHDGALRLCGGLYWYAYGSGNSEVFNWAERAADRFAAVDHPAMATACACAAVGAWRRGDLTRSRVLAERGVASAIPPSGGRFALCAVGDVEGFAGNFEQAFAYYREGADQCRGAGDAVGEAFALGNCAMVLAYAGHASQACRAADDALALVADNPSMLAWALYAAGEARIDAAPLEAVSHLERGLAEAARVPNRFILAAAGLSAVSCQARTAADPEATLGRFPELIEYWERAGAWNQQWLTIRALGEALVRSGRPEPAAVLQGALAVSPTAIPAAGPDAVREQEVLDQLQEVLDPETLADRRAQGERLGDTGAVAYALATLRDTTGAMQEAPVTAPRPPGGGHRPAGAIDGALPVGDGAPVTILFTDVEGSTDLRTRRGDDAAHGILRAHEGLVRGCVAEHGGREVKALGDGFMIAFASARNALTCAIAIQQATEAHRRATPETAVRVRIGVNTGQVVAEDDDLYGQAVNAAARIAGRAEAGEILVAEVTKQLVGSNPGLPFVDRGRLRLKGFPERWRLFALRWEPPDTALDLRAAPTA